MWWLACLTTFPLVQSSAVMVNYAKGERDAEPTPAPGLDDWVKRTGWKP